MSGTSIRPRTPATIPVNSAPIMACSSRPRAAVVVAELDDAADDVDAQEEHGQRPPRIAVAHRQQGADRAEAGSDDSDHPAERVAGEQREPSGELDDTEDDQEPAHRVEVREHESLVSDEHSGAIQ